MNKKMEILAPAGSFESLVAAVACGADAVYLGSKSLNARRNAGNFEYDELKRAVEYCHLRGVKLYQALNIVMFENEIEEAVEAIKIAAELGVDAIIAQDLGIAKLAQECAPQIPLHASTQMAIHNLAGALQAKELGFERIVLARELTASEIANIAKDTDLDIEVFVHGALCMSVSGQCYLSSMIGERSGNRGLCAQPCRLPFKAKGGEEYALSLKDLTLVDRVAELKKSGVLSLKIEGRMKRPEYVAAAVTALKNAMNGSWVDFDTLRSVFSRSGFTKGYFEGNIDANMFGYRQKEDVVSAHGVLNDLAKLYAKETARVAVDLQFTAKAGEPIVLSVADENGFAAQVSGEAPQVAINKPTTAEKAEQNLTKTGGTPFYVRKAAIDIDDGLMIPASVLNAVRREALDMIAAQRSAVTPHPFADNVQRAHPKLLSHKVPSLYARLRGAQLTEFVAENCAKLIIPVADLPNIVRREIIKDKSKLVAEIPRILFKGEEAMLEKLKELVALGVTQAWCGNLGAVRLAQQAGMEVMGGYSLNITNSHALASYSTLGVSSAELSFELNLQQAKSLGDYIPTGILGYGYLPLMALRNCPIQAAIGCDKCKGYETLTDRKGVKFPVDCSSGISELFNSVPLYLAERKRELEGFDFITLYFTKESREQCDEIVHAYMAGTPMAGEKTRGLYYRNVL